MSTVWKLSGGKPRIEALYVRREDAVASLRITYSKLVHEVRDGGRRTKLVEVIVPGDELSRPHGVESVNQFRLEEVELNTEAGHL